MILLDGKHLSKELEAHLKEEVSDLSATPTLVIIQVGGLAESNTYIKLKMKCAKRIGVNAVHLKLPGDITQKDLESIVHKQCQEAVSGVIVQLPIPAHLDTNAVLKQIDPKKDVDGLNPYSLGELFSSDPGFAPATPKGVMTLLKHYRVPLEGKNVVIIGRSVVVGKPLAALMLKEGATVTICHRKTKDLVGFTKRADILIAAAGNPRMITGYMVKKDVVAVDVGFSRIDGISVGDISEEVKEKASYLTPVPGGVGPMTVISLLENVIEASKKG